MWDSEPSMSLAKPHGFLKEMRRCRLYILGISECRWTGSGKINTKLEKPSITPVDILTSSNGVAIAMTKEASSTHELGIHGHRAVRVL